MKSWTEYWMEVADLAASRSKCSRRQVGAVLVEPDNKHMVSMGYNGAPKGFPEAEGTTCRDFCPRALESQPGNSYGLGCVSVHSEVNSMLVARRSLEGLIIYVNSAMCGDCAKIVANSGIKKVVMRVDKEDAHRQPEKVIAFLKDCGLAVEII